MQSDLSDLRYLYYFGEYITDNELETAKHLLEMPEEKIDEIISEMQELLDDLKGE